LLRSARLCGLLEGKLVVLGVVIDHVGDCSHVDRFRILAGCHQTVRANVEVNLIGRLGLLVLLRRLTPERLHVSRSLSALGTRDDLGLGTLKCRILPLTNHSLVARRRLLLRQVLRLIEVLLRPLFGLDEVKGYGRRLVMIGFQPFVLFSRGLPLYDD
jgi:hypothetical protein